MKLKRQSFAVFGMAVILCVTNCMADTPPSSPLETTMKNEIAKFAKEMEVLPLNVITPLTRESIVSYRTEPRHFRYDVTIERYHVFYRFKLWAQNLSKEEYLLLPSLAEQMEGKERSLVLVSLFIYEMTYKPEFRPRHYWVNGLYERKPEKTEITKEEWDLCTNTYKKYVDDQALAFPAIEKVDSFTITHQKYREASKKLSKLLKVTEYYETGGHIKDFCSSENIQKKYPTEAEELRFLDEFCRGIDAAGFASGVDMSGNSSATPKTVGDIAKRLLETRKWMLEYTKTNKESLEATENTNSNP